MATSRTLPESGPGPISPAPTRRKRPGPRRWRASALLVPCLLLLVAGCSPAPPPAEWTVDLVEELSLGGDDADASTAFYEPMDLAVDGHGKVHVLDTGNHRVQVFDGDGRFVRTDGVLGSGPGGLREPMGLWVYPSGETFVADTGNRRLQRFGAGGGPLDTISLEFPPLDLIGLPDRLLVLRFPDASLVLGADPSALIQVLARSDGSWMDGYVLPREADAGILYMLHNLYRLAPAPGGFALADTHIVSRVRLYGPGGQFEAEIPVLYKADAWAPLGRVPRRVEAEAVERIARTATDLAWDPRRSVFWVLSGYVDRTPDGEWISGRELYRYGPDATYRGSVMLPVDGFRVALGPDGRVWVLDVEGVVRAYRVEDPELAPRRSDSSAVPLPAGTE